jgi:signal transduction histidine kinase
MLPFAFPRLKAVWCALYCLLLCLPGPPARAQIPLPLPRLRVLHDSLSQLLARDARRDTVRVRRLNSLAFALRLQDPPQARGLARQALALAQRLHYAPGLVEAHFTLGYDFRARSLYDSAIYHSQQALGWATRTGNRFTQSRALYNLCRIYTEQGNYAAAVGPSLDGLALARALHQPKVEVLQLVQASRIELGLGEVEIARRNLLEALRMLPATHDSTCIGFVYQGLGDLNRQLGRWRAARAAYVRTISAYSALYTERLLLPLELDAAAMTERLRDYPAAYRAARPLLARARAIGTPEQLAQAALLLARTWRPTRPDSARAYASLSLATAASHRLLPIARDAALLLAQASDQLGQPRQAYHYQVQATAYADTLSGEDTRRRLAAAQARAAHSRIQTQLTLLQQEQELAALRVRQQLLGIIGAAGLLLLLAGGFFWQYRRRQQARRAQAIAVLRQRLAADLHDDVGALLTQVSLQADLLQETPRTAPQQLAARLQRLSDTSRQAARQMADVVWGLHDSSTDLPEVLEHMRDHAHEVLPLAGLAVRFAISPEAASAQPTVAVCQTLYLLYKEALHNVVKHARGATWVAVTLSSSAGQLCLQVQDNAAGPALVFRPGGQGLPNMRRRAEAVGGTLHVQSLPTGFELSACLPTSGRKA